MRISDWSSDVCSADLGNLGCRIDQRPAVACRQQAGDQIVARRHAAGPVCCASRLSMARVSAGVAGLNTIMVSPSASSTAKGEYSSTNGPETGRRACGERGGEYGWIWVVGG